MYNLILIVISMLALSGCGKDGVPGSVGQQGPQGVQGEPGDDGQDSEPAEVIVLCPHITVSYPEVVLKMNGNLYGTKTKSGKSYLVELVPGTYRTQDGRNCDYVVESDGVTLTWLD